MTPRNKKLKEYIQTRFANIPISYQAHPFNNVVFFFGVLHKTHPLYQKGERAIISCYRRRSRKGKEYLYWSSAWIIDENELDCMQEGIGWIQQNRRVS